MLEQGLIPRLVDLAKFENRELRLNALWAFMNLLQKLRFKPRTRKRAGVQRNRLKIAAICLTGNLNHPRNSADEN
jgi:hypothetical protein